MSATCREGAIEGSLEPVPGFYRWCRKEEAIAAGRIERIDEG